MPDVIPGRPRLHERPSVRDVCDWFAYNPDTGSVVWKKSPRASIPAGTEAGCVWNTRTPGLRYRRLKLRGLYHLLHTIAFVLAYGRYPACILDHVNGDGTDNRLVNIRESTIAENNRNKRPRSHARGGNTSPKGAGNNPAGQRLAHDTGKCPA